MNKFTIRVSGNAERRLGPARETNRLDPLQARLASVEAKDRADARGGVSRST
jgi:hypothetical protein